MGSASLGTGRSVYMHQEIQHSTLKDDHPVCDPLRPHFPTSSQERYSLLCLQPLPHTATRACLACPTHLRTFSLQHLPATHPAAFCSPYARTCAMLPDATGSASNDSNSAQRPLPSLLPP